LKAKAGFGIDPWLEAEQLAAATAEAEH